MHPAPSGAGWRYLDERGRTVRDRRLKDRFAALAIPPAWRDVWICRSSRGHLQATGVDDAGRTQYIYHPAWHEQRQREKYERILRFADGLPDLRRMTAAQLRRRTLDREKALAAAVQLLDRTHVRVGSEQYAGRPGDPALAPHHDRGRHARPRLRGQGRRRPPRGGDRRPPGARHRGDGRPSGYEVFSYRDEHGEVAGVLSADVNAYIKERMGEDFSAKDFRTWAGTVAAAVAPDEVGPIEGARERRRAVARVCRLAAELLGNTPAVCRASYIDPRVIDPRVIDHFLDGRTISTLRSAVEERLEEGHTAEEIAVLALLGRGLEDRPR